MDTTGEQHLQIEHNIYKRRLDLDGKPLQEPQKTGETFVPSCQYLLFFYFHYL